MPAVRGSLERSCSSKYSSNKELLIVLIQANPSTSLRAAQIVQQEASMQKLIEEIIDNYKIATGKEAKIYTTPATPEKCLMKHTGDPVKLDAYRLLVGKVMYYTTKLAPELSNAARELASHLPNPGEEHWHELGRLVGYF